MAGGARGKFAITEIEAGDVKIAVVELFIVSVVNQFA
jgi:hypothetical protein